MGQVKFYSDPHFGHQNISKWRGFESIEEMDEYLVSIWNKNVLKRDTVWILGDITMSRNKYQILERLNGIKKVVLGNHDKPQHVRSLLNHVNSVCGAIKYREAILTHIPIHPREFINAKYNMHGHVHEKNLKEDGYINVSAEVIDYIPRTYEELTSQYNEHNSGGNKGL